MPQSMFARALPANIKITEKYYYDAVISGNPSIEEKGEPEGEIEVEVPYDGWQYFTRPAYKDIQHQHVATSGDLFASIGHLVANNISHEHFWKEESNPPNTKSLNLLIPIPNDASKLDSLISDQRRAVFRHIYRPDWPEVHPRPRPISLEINLRDERTMLDSIGIEANLNEWMGMLDPEQLSFERSLLFFFEIGLALPTHVSVDKTPILRLMRLEWPVATSYHMLLLQVENKNSFVEHNLYYIPEKESIEWRDLKFISDPSQRNVLAKGISTDQGPRFYRAPLMVLSVREPGELYRKPTLVARLELELPGVLLSGMRPHYFDATGQNNTSVKVEASTRIIVDIDLNLEQRFNRKVLSPHQHLQFEGVLLEEIRMADIASLLKDLGFRVEKPRELPESLGDRRIFVLTGRKSEGPDEMKIWILAKGTFANTERETIIPGGKSFKTTVRSGNTELDIRAELRGDVHKLMRVMNTLQTSLKERFRHVTTIE